MQTSKYGSTFELNEKLVPASSERKKLIERHDEIDNLTQAYLKDLARLMGVHIHEMGHFDTSAEVRDLAMESLEEEFSSLLPEIDFNY